MTKPVAWSYSALTAFETCPWRYYLTKVAKEVSEPQTEATTWGRKVHKDLELRLGGKPLPADTAQYEKFAATVLNKGGRIETEKKMAVNAAFQPVAYFAKDVWCRAVSDFTVEKGRNLFAGDWKTGKPTPDSQQLALSAAMEFAHRPYIEKVIVSFIWLNTGTLTTNVYKKDDAVGIWQEFLPRVQRLEIAVRDNKFPKRPSGLCKKWCPVSKDRCEFRGE